MDINAVIARHGHRCFTPHVLTTDLAQDLAKDGTSRRLGGVTAAGAGAQRGSTNSCHDSAEFLRSNTPGHYTDYVNKLRSELEQEHSARKEEHAELQRQSTFRRLTSICLFR